MDFNFAPAPVNTGLQLSQDGRITSPIWLAWFTRQLTPVLQAIVSNDQSIQDLLAFGKTSDGGAITAAEALHLGMQFPQANVVDQFPPQTPVDAIANEFPPPNPTVHPSNDLALFTATMAASQRFPSLLSDTKANRANYPAASYPVGTLFAATDWKVTWRSDGANWVYLSGQYDSTLSNIPTLTANDAGFKFGVTDYMHSLTWSGSAWGWTPGDGGSGFDAPFEVDPGTGWHVLDGSSVAYLKSDGTTGTTTLPDESTAFYMKAGSSKTGPNAATAPTFTGTALTAHFHDAPIGVDLSNNIYALNVFGTGNSATALDVVAGTGNSSAQTALRTSPDSAGTPAGTVSDTGEPRNYQRKWYFRQ